MWFSSMERLHGWDGGEGLGDGRPYHVPYARFRALTFSAREVGNGTSGSSTLELTKQWWYAVPVSTTLIPVPNNGPNASTTSAAAPSTATISSSTSSAVKSSLTSSQSPKSSSATSSSLSSPSVSKSSSKSATPSSSTTSKSLSTSSSKSSILTTSQSATIATSSPSPSLQPSASPLHIILNPKFVATPTARRRSVDLTKKAVAAPVQYYIIAQDHIGDMPAMALIPSALDTSGGYVSTALDYWSITAPEQLWIFVLQ